MALFSANFYSTSLRRKVSMTAILPVDSLTPIYTSDKKSCSYENLKTLYLLHGITDNQTDWVSCTGIERLAEEKNLVVIMPAGDNSFYVDQPGGNNNYGQFIGDELVSITRKMFRLSTKREDTYIAGVSMGGFGALRNGLCNSDTFGCIGAFSSALHLFEEPGLDKWDDSIGLGFSNKAVFGEYKEAAISNKNPRIALLEAIKNQKSIPDIYMCCGTEDSLISANRSFRDFLHANGVNVTYEEAHGEHGWPFWNVYLPKFLDWLPLENKL